MTKGNVTVPILPIITYIRLIKIVKDLKFWPNWWNFVKSGRTVVHRNNGHLRWCDGAISFLSGCVPNLSLDHFAVHLKDLTQFLSKVLFETSIFHIVVQVLTSKQMLFKFINFWEIKISSKKVFYNLNYWIIFGKPVGLSPNL